MDFLDTLAPITALGIGPIAIVAGVFTRISALAFFLPGLGERTVNVRVRLAAAMAIALIVTPIVVESGPSVPETLSATALMICAEAVAGAIIGFSIRVAIYALQTAGSMAAQHISLSQLFGATVSDQAEPPLATLFMMTGVVIAVAAGIHFKAIGALAVSYDVMPFGVFPAGGDTASWAAERTAFAFSAALSLALPFVVLGFLYNLAIGAANRAMPQLMVAFVGAPAITLAGLTLVALATPLMIGVWLKMVDAIFLTLMGAGP